MKSVIAITTLALSIPSISFAYSTASSNILDSSGHTMHIDGVNWAGFQDSGFVDELYGAVPFYALKSSNPFGLIDLLTHPWDNPATGVDKNNSVSFKTLRLPIQPNNLNDKSENTHFRFDLTSKSEPLLGNGPFCNSWDQEHCIKGLTVAESLYTFIDEMKKNKVNILVDFHQTPQGRTGDVVTSAYSLKNYYDNLALLSKEIKQRELTNVIGIDVFNEPHNLYWYDANGTQPAWTDVIATAAKSIYQNNPDLILFVEGPSSDSDPSMPTICIPKDMNTPLDPDAYQLSDSNECGNNAKQAFFKANWGENFKSLLNKDEAKKGNAVFDDETFRKTLCEKTDKATCDWLLGKPNDPQSPAHLAFSPHVYGQHVATWQSTPDASPVRFDYNWGFLIKTRYPVVIGEAGYLATQLSDVSFFEQSLMPYLISKGINHNLFYWTFNTNSGDTGGIRADQNSVELVGVKEKDLHTLFNGSDAFALD